MNSSQIHLALTHIPVILSLVGFMVLVVALLKRNDILIKTAFYLLLFAGVFAVPVFFSGEGAEETIESLPGMSESVIEKHEEVAKVAFGVVSATAIVSLMGLLLYRQLGIRRLIKPFLLILSLATASIMSVVAHLGGQIRHTEIRSGSNTQMENASNSNLPDKGSDDNE
ncbi:DUF2231 domain-containing protein [Flavitalea antarctica]